MLTHVGCDLVFDVTADLVLALQVAPATTAGQIVEEHLLTTLDGAPLSGPIDEIATDHGGRTHVVQGGPGRLAVSYAATIDIAGAPAVPHTPFDEEAIVALRQSRYCPSDEMVGFAATELADLPPGEERAAAIASWVFERLAYEIGSSGPLDSAVDTLLANAGVCRDFAHVTIALCRAVGIPARLVAVYAPGLSPMDFHAVVEVRTGDAWEVLDATRLAPRPSLVRIATGRDAADTAFATTLRGEAELLSTSVLAVVDGDLPLDDHRTRLGLA